jgi:hypothetical protein
MFSKVQGANRALAGKLSDVSLGELIGFFCSQRKTGRLRVDYPKMPGVFYIHNGRLVDAKIGALNGNDAIFYALILSPDTIKSLGDLDLVQRVLYEAGMATADTSTITFEFNPSILSTRHTISEPWSNLIMKGIERLENGIPPEDPFAGEDRFDPAYFELFTEFTSSHSHSFLNGAREDKPLDTLITDLTNSSDNNQIYNDEYEDGSSYEEVEETRRGRPWLKIAAGVVLCVMAIGLWKLIFSGKEETLAVTPTPTSIFKPHVISPTPETADNLNNQGSNGAEGNNHKSEEPAFVKVTPKRKQVVAEAEDGAITISPSADSSESSEPILVGDGSEIEASAKATEGSSHSDLLLIKVKMTYDEEGRVQEAKVLNPSDATSVHEATVLRKARMKRFPAGKSGTATMNFPVSTLGSSSDISQ